MGTPEFALPSLRGLIESGYEVVAVYTQPDKPSGRGQRLRPSPVKGLALELGLRISQPATLRKPEEAQALSNLKPDVIVVAAYGKILPQEVLSIPSHGCINVHPSLLPKHRGASPVASAILAGDEVTGATIMLMDVGMDTGPVLAQSSMPLLPEDTTGSLALKLAMAGGKLLLETLPRWISGELKPLPQDSAKATYCKPISKEDGKIDWLKSAGEIWRRVRAYQPWPGCFTIWQGQILKILEAVPLPAQEGVAPGLVVSLARSETPVGVGTGEGILGIRGIQLAGRRVVSAREFITGQRSFIGSTLD